MGIAATYGQIPPLSELSGMAGGQGYYDVAGQPSAFAAAPWPAPHLGTDPWGGIDPQNYSGGGMPPAIPVFPTGFMPASVPMPVPPHPPQGQGPPAAAAGPFDPRNYVPPVGESAQAQFDARNYVPPDAQPYIPTYEPHTSESAFNNSMNLHGGNVTSPVVPPAAFLLSPMQSSISSGLSFPQSPSGLSRSISARTTDREAWLYDRPGTWRPRFQMPRSGVSSLLPNLTRGKNFPPGASDIRQFFCEGGVIELVRSPP
jgi:hypothetical protein